MLLSVGVDDRGAAIGLRGVDRMIGEAQKRMKLAPAFEKGMGSLFGVAGGGGAIAMEFAFVSKAVRDYESRMLEGERATGRFRAGVADMSTAVGRDFETLLKVWDQDLAGVGGFGGAFNRLTSHLGTVFGPPGSRQNIAGVDAAVALSEKQTRDIIQQRENQRMILEQRQRMAGLSGDEVGAAEAEAAAYINAAKERLAAAQAAGRINGAQYSERLSGERAIADQMVGNAKRRAAEEADAQRAKWSTDLDRAADEKRRAQEERDRDAEQMAKDARDRARAGEDARLRVEEAGVSRLRADGLVDEADQLDVILRMRREMLDVDRNELLMESEKASLREAMKGETESALKMLANRGGGAIVNDVRGTLDSTASAGAARAFGQVFGGGGTAAPMVQTSRDVQSIDATLKSVLGALQRIVGNTEDSAASYTM